jgi:hypothetical protein
MRKARHFFLKSLLVSLYYDNDDREKNKNVIKHFACYDVAEASVSIVDSVIKKSKRRPPNRIQGCIRQTKQKVKGKKEIEKKWTTLTVNLFRTSRGITTPHRSFVFPTIHSFFGLLINLKSFL